MITSAESNRMTQALLARAPFATANVPDTAEYHAFWEALARDIQAIQAKGLVVDLPHDG